MAFEVPAHFADQFTTNVELLLQQTVPMMLEGVMVASYTGSKSAQVVKQFGEVEFQTKTSRNADTLFSEIDHKQRWIFPTDFSLALPVDTEDEIRMLNSPVSSYATAMRAAWARKVNTVIVDALLGTAKTGENGGTSTSFPAGQTVASGSTGLTVTKLRTALEMLDGDENDPNDKKYFAMTAKQRTDLLETTEVTSSDYNTVKALVNGAVDEFLGFKFMRNQKLGVDGASARRCIAWVKSGCVYGQWNGLTTKIGERPDKEYLTQVFMAGTNGAARTQELKVVEVLCSE